MVDTPSPHRDFSAEIDGVKRDQRRRTAAAAGDIGDLEQRVAALERRGTDDVPGEIQRLEQTIDGFVTQLHRLRGTRMPHEIHDAARRTLQRLGWHWEGGQEWKPPVGKAPNWEQRQGPVERRAILANQVFIMTALHQLLRGFLSPQPLEQERLKSRIDATRELLEASPTGDPEAK